MKLVISSETFESLSVITDTVVWSFLVDLTEKTTFSKKSKMLQHSLGYLIP